MATDHGKTARLLSRLPHFYKPGDLEKDFLHLYEALGASLERMEHDLFAVQKAHHVQTAENVGSKGYTAKPQEHGDLDKLFSLYLETLGGTSQLVKMNPRFTRKSFYLEKLLSTLYHTTEDLPRQLQARLLALAEVAPEADPVLEFLPETIRYRTDEIGPPLVLGLLLKSTPLMRYLADRLDDATRKLLGTYTGQGGVPTELAEGLQAFMNQTVLKDPYLFPLNFDNLWSELPLDADTRQRRDSLHREFLTQYWKKKFDEDPAIFDHNQANLEQRLQELRFAEPAATPALHDVQRLNRALMDAYMEHHPPAEGSQPWGISPRNIPGARAVAELLRDRFNLLLDDQSPEGRAFFETALASIPQNLQLPGLYTTMPDMLRRQVLEHMLPYEIEHLYRSYQRRMQAIMQVLRKGASTRQGIVDIVAANFGLFGKDPEVLHTKSLIQIDEFDPEETHFGKTLVSLSEPFEIYNANQDAVIPRVRVTMLPAQIKEIRNLRLINEADGSYFTVPLTLQAGDVFTVETDGLFFNGVQAEVTVKGPVHELPGRHTVQWRVEAEIRSNNIDDYGTYGRYQETEHNDAIFISPLEKFLEVEVLSYKLTYGAFSINIPWHIEGVTDKFAETTDHPRHQIRSLVNKVKAAGVRVSVAYKQVFAEDHELTDRFDLSLSGPGLQETHEQADAFTIDSRLGMQETHELTDGIRLSATFDYTEFNSGNTFG